MSFLSQSKWAVKVNFHPKIVSLRLRQKSHGLGLSPKGTRPLLVLSIIPSFLRSKAASFKLLIEEDVDV